MSDKPKFGAGALGAFGRQGLAELGSALKPLPDSIQHDAMGSVIYPVPGDISQSKGAGPRAGPEPDPGPEPEP